MKKCSIVLLVALMVGVGGQILGMKEEGIKTSNFLNLKPLALPDLTISRTKQDRVAKLKQIFYRDKAITGLSMMNIGGTRVALISSNDGKHALITSLVMSPDGKIVMKDLLNAGSYPDYKTSMTYRMKRNPFFDTSSLTIAAYKNVFARVDNLYTIVYCYALEEGIPKIVESRIGSKHSTETERIQLGEYIFTDKTDKPEISVATNSIWPTLRIHSAPSEKGAENLFKEMEYPNSYLLDFNGTGLVYGQINDAKKLNFFQRYFQRGDRVIDIMVRNHSSDKMKDSVLIGSFTTPAKKIYRNVFASTQGDTTVVLHQYKEKTKAKTKNIDFHVHIDRQGNANDTTFLASYLGLENQKIQKTYLVKKEKNLIVVTNGCLLLFNVDATAGVTNPWLQKETPLGAPLNIQASCMEGDKLFIIHKKKTEKGKDNDYQLFELDVNTPVQPKFINERLKSNE
jgi:hypothetical protein